jgi:hypothetical protein
LKSKKYNITRLTSLNEDEEEENITNIYVKCIDDNKDSKISLNYDIESSKKYIDDTKKQSNRTYATLIIKPKISIDKQKKLVQTFNTFLNEKRDAYNSLFLTNYRESKDIARKRISFDLVYNITGYLLDDL